MNIKEISSPVDLHINEFNKYFKKLLKSDVSLLNIILNYVARKKGKQLRPMMVFLSAELCGGVNQRSFTGAAMIELLHIATLIHDDVVDQAKERRGLPSVNAVWNNKIAVLIGDYLLAKGLLASIDGSEFDFLRVTSVAVRRMSEGELLQIQKSKDFDTDESIYYRIISDKTASLISSCCEIGAISATDNPEFHEAMVNYGELIGMAFQIKDDIFDFAGNSSLLGKPVGNDLKEKKLTLPIIYSLKNASKKEAREIIRLIKNGGLRKKELARIFAFAKEFGGLDYAMNQARDFSARAVQALTPFDDSVAKEALINFANFVIERDF